MIELALDTETVERFLTEFIRTEFQAAGKNKTVIGLSGGLDSATAAYLGVKALGRDNVMGFLLPYKSSSPASLEDGALVAESLGIRYETIDITPMVDAYLALVPGAGPIRAGNVMARQRMIVLYDKSAEHSALVLGTGNKTEYWLGYTTLWGDMACAMAPLGDLYKTQVRQLAGHLRVPQMVIDKAPSADLWEGQTDEEELGFTYEKVDRLLHYMIDRCYTMPLLIDLGYTVEFITTVFGIIQSTQFKRTTPLVAQIPLNPDNQVCHAGGDRGA